MDLYQKLLSEGSALTPYDGITPPNMATNPNSQLHNSYSVNGQPNLPLAPEPTRLGLDGETPIKYIDTISDFTFQ